jgi:ribosomal protein S18 acetylase RimI-like enzyme
MDVTLRTATLADVPTLIAIEASAPATRVYFPLLTEQAWAEEMAKYTVELITVDETAVGNVVYGEVEPGRVYIGGLIVRPAYRGRGIATNVIRRIIEQFPTARRLDLVTHPDNPARRIYERLGFKVEGARDNHFGDGQPRLILARVMG